MIEMFRKRGLGLKRVYRGYVYCLITSVYTKAWGCSSVVVYRDNAGECSNSSPRIAKTYSAEDGIISI